MLGPAGALQAAVRCPLARDCLLYSSSQLFWTYNLALAQVRVA